MPSVCAWCSARGKARGAALRLAGCAIDAGAFPRTQTRLCSLGRIAGLSVASLMSSGTERKAVRWGSPAYGVKEPKIAPIMLADAMGRTFVLQTTRSRVAAQSASERQTPNLPPERSAERSWSGLAEIPRRCVFARFAGAAMSAKIISVPLHAGK